MQIIICIILQSYNPKNPSKAMKKMNFLASFLIMMLFAGANNAFAQNAAAATTTEEYMGVIGKDMYITMILKPIEMKGETITYEGTYSYAKTGGLMLVMGKINTKTGTFAFTEKNEKGTTTGFFNGRKKGDKVTGKWSSYDQKTRFTFDLAIKR